MEKIMLIYKFFVKLKVKVKIFTENVLSLLLFLTIFILDVVFFDRQTKLLCIWTDL